MELIWCFARIVYFFFFYIRYISTNFIKQVATFLYWRSFPNIGQINDISIIVRIGARNSIPCDPEFSLSIIASGMSYAGRFAYAMIGGCAPRCITIERPHREH